MHRFISHKWIPLRFKLEAHLAKLHIGPNCQLNYYGFGHKIKSKRHIRTSTSRHQLRNRVVSQDIGQGLMTNKHNKPRHVFLGNEVETPFKKCDIVTKKFKGIFSNTALFVSSIITGNLSTDNDNEASNDEEGKNVEIVHRCNRNQVVFDRQEEFSYSFSSFASMPRQVFLFNIEEDGFEVETHFKDDDHGFSCFDTEKNTMIMNDKALVLFNETDHDCDSVSCHDHDKDMEEQISLSLNYEDTSRISDFSSIDVNFNDELIPSFRWSISPPAEGSPSDYGYSSFVYVSNSPDEDDLDLKYEFPSAQHRSNSPAREEEEEEDKGVNYEYSSFSYSCNSADEDDQEAKECSFIVCGSVSVAVEPAINGREAENVDEFYKKYTEQMRWFDVLSYDRSYGISAILREQVSTSKSGRRRLLRSLESDLELVYVGQSCLSWEALHHQYKKMKILAQKSGQVIFCSDVASEFQKFQVLLERFMEDELCELSDERVVNYVRRRSFLKTLLQVPTLPEVVEEEAEERRGEAVNGRDVLKAIEKCIKAFWNFVRSDRKTKPWWKLRNSFWTECAPVEHPSDLKLFAHLTTNLQKKKLWLKNARGKKNCWIRKVMREISEDDERKEMLFTMIEMKLISRVLQMPAVSSSQLKWCQQKLNNICLKDGKLTRTSTHHALLFPS